MSEINAKVDMVYGLQYRTMKNYFLDTVKLGCRKMLNVIQFLNKNRKTDNIMYIDIVEFKAEDYS